MFNFSNSYSDLPERFYARLNPTSVSCPELVTVNRLLASDLGLDPNKLESDAGIEVLSGNKVPEGASPLAMAYAGHQFGGWVPQLGDGRAILLGEVMDSGGTRYDIQLKGSGPTPYSRRGDGRSWIGPVLREYLVSEAMHALGIPATRALAAVTTGDPVFRENAFPGAVMTRVAKSHVRVGTFQYFYARNDTEALKLLVDYSIRRLYPELLGTDDPILSMLDAVVSGQAQLIAKWMGVGFIHGVMNTDNTSIACETIDFGPCAFMDEFHPNKVFSSIDHGGRYAYSNQPAICLWNLAQFATTLVPLLSADRDVAVKLATDSINRFHEHFSRAWISLFSSKLGLPPDADNQHLIVGFLELLQESRSDFTLAFRMLSRIGDDQESQQEYHQFFGGGAKAIKWLNNWKLLLRQYQTPVQDRQAAMLAVNPVIIPRNHLIEQAIRDAVAGKFGLFKSLNRAWSAPFRERSLSDRLAVPPSADEVVTRTFCGT